MTVTTLLVLSAVVCLVGIILKLSTWYSQAIRPGDDRPIAASARVAASGKAILASLFGPKIVAIAQSLFLDLLLQKRILDKNLLRWIAHTLIFSGFMLLLVMHALHGVFADVLFDNYQSTLNPFLLLRDVFGIMVLVGLAIAVYRRLSLRPHRLKSTTGDWAALIFIAVIILSGILLGGVKMASYSEYQAMVDEYASLSDDEESKALEAYWVAENGLISPNFASAPAPEVVAAGKDLNEGTCTECHVSNRYAFAGFAASKTAPLFFAVFGDAGAVQFLTFFHLLACFAFLAWLPFSKMFHIVAAPLSLIVKRVTGDQVKDPANVLTRQMLGLSACTHCGTCSLECSSGMFYESFNNDFILPSEKVQYLKKIAAGKESDPEVLRKLQQGLYVCTSCDRCTTVCPSGINLKELFVSSRYTLLAKGVPEPTLLSHFSFPLALAQNFVGDHLKALKKVTELFRKSFRHLADLSLPLTLGSDPALANTTFKGCYSCQRCTNICPVVRSYDNPSEALGLLPHQIMYSLGIGNTELAMGSQMIWSCSTCYLCQEHCPNQVELCDIFYSLKNGALSTIEGGAKA
jgi:heterodisulfide reductase subunit C/nitrate reductase gamma subunit